MRWFALMAVVLLGCDHDSVTPRALPGSELCDALAQVCPLGEIECTEMHLACLGGAPCKACTLAVEVPGLACELVQVCESYNVPSQCDPICSGP